MHGTHIAGRRLRGGVTESLYEGDNILFGAEVARGDGKLQRQEKVSVKLANEPIRNLPPDRRHCVL